MDIVGGSRATHFYKLVLTPRYRVRLCIALLLVFTTILQWNQTVRVGSVILPVRHYIDATENPSNSTPPWVFSNYAKAQQDIAKWSHNQQLLLFASTGLSLLLAAINFFWPG